MMHCRKCKYSLDGLDGTTCPECGFPNTPDAILDLEQRRKRRVTVVTCAITALVALTCAFTSPIGCVNVGSPFGYYGDLNRTKWRIDAIDGVDVVDVKANYDLTIEEMNFGVLIDDTHRARVNISGAPTWVRFAEVDAWEKHTLPLIRQLANTPASPDPKPE